jgi:hypothetical protein
MSTISLWINIPADYTRFDFTSIINAHSFDTIVVFWGKERDIKDFEQMCSEMYPQNGCNYFVIPSTPWNPSSYYSTDYYCFLNMPLSLGENYSTEIYNALSTNDSNNDLVNYSLGFVAQDDGSIKYSEQILPALAGHFALEKLFSEPIWISQFVQYYFSNDIIEGQDLLVHSDEHEPKECVIRLTIDYFARVYKIVGLVEPSYRFFPSGFLTTLTGNFDDRSYESLPDILTLTKSIWLTNPNNKIANRYKQVQRRNKLKK